MSVKLNSTSLPLWRQDFRLTLRLALPLIFAEVGWMSMGIVDTIMVGRLPNSAVAIGATGLGQSLYHSVAIFGGGLLLGMDTFVAQAFGREDLDDARHSLVNGLFLAFVLTPLLMLAVSLWPALMQRFGISPELVEPMRPYLRALNWGTLPLLAYFALRRYLQAVNVAHPIMFALVSANIVNAFGNWVLIYGHLGFRAMGITGSGWSTCWARVYMALCLAITLLWVESKRLRPGWMGMVRIDVRRMSALLKLGAPAATQILCEIGAFSAATALIARLGPVALAGHEIALNCAALTFMVPLGISSAAAVRVGQQLGRRDPDGARRAGWSAIIIGVGFMACSGSVVRLHSKTDRAPVHAESRRDSGGRATLAGRRRIPIVRRPADRRHRSVARRRRHAHSHARQLRRLLADGPSPGLRPMFQTRMGRARHLDRALRRPDDHRIGPADHVAQEKAKLSNLGRLCPLWLMN